jgi:hypothetical protein
VQLSFERSADCEGRLLMLLARWYAMKTGSALLVWMPFVGLVDIAAYTWRLWPRACFLQSHLMAFLPSKLVVWAVLAMKLFGSYSGAIALRYSLSLLSFSRRFVGHSARHCHCRNVRHVAQHSSPHHLHLMLCGCHNVINHSPLSLLQPGPLGLLRRVRQGIRRQLQSVQAPREQAEADR